MVSWFARTRKQLHTLVCEYEDRSMMSGTRVQASG